MHQLLRADTLKQKTSEASGTFKGRMKSKQCKSITQSVEQRQQLFELWRKAGILKSENTTVSIKKLVTRVAALEAKQTTVALTAY